MGGGASKPTKEEEATISKMQARQRGRAVRGGVGSSRVGRAGVRGAAALGREECRAPVGVPRQDRPGQPLRTALAEGRRLEIAKQEAFE